MSEFVPDGKRRVRAELRERMKSFSVEQRVSLSARAGALLLQQSCWSRAASVLFYAPLKYEIDLSSLIGTAIQLGKQVALPGYVRESGAYGAFQVRNLSDDCAPGEFGILEPSGGCPGCPLNQLDLVLVPGVGFDFAGHRLGRGKGFYDRMLAGISGIKCGVAFDEQLVEAIPVESHDVAMNCILTPTRWLEVGGRRPV